MTLVCHGLLSLPPFTQLRLHLCHDVLRRMQANQSFNERYAATDRIVDIISQPSWFILLVQRLLSVRYAAAAELVCGPFSQALHRCFLRQGCRCRDGPGMNATSFAALWVPVILGTATEGLRRHLSLGFAYLTSLRLGPREVARLSRQLPVKDRWSLPSAFIFDAATKDNRFTGIIILRLTGARPPNRHL